MADLKLNDPRSGDDRRSPLLPFGNGKKRIGYIVLSGVVTVSGTIATSYWTAEKTAAREHEKSQTAMEKALAVVEERQRNQNDAVLRELQALRDDVRALSRGLR